MNLLQLQERLKELTESERFVSLESFQDEFLHSALEGFEKFVAFRDNSYLSKALFWTEKFEIRLLYWKPFQETPKHPHPQNGCLMKILEGRLMEEKFSDNKTIKTVYKKGNVGYIKASESHILKNSEAESVSLHIFSPSGFYDMVNKENSNLD
jgi:quercetin dioxygenase-like cupin family protein